VAKIKYRYVPPGNHRTLHAERDIRTFKEHFIATRAGVDPSFPANMWDELLDQVDLTLNILRPCMGLRMRTIRLHAEPHWPRRCESTCLRVSKRSNIVRRPCRNSMEALQMIQSVDTVDAQLPSL
jgi:hypothetical protein